MAQINVPDKDNANRVQEHGEAIRRLARLANQVRSLQARLDEATAARNVLGDLVRRWLVREKPALDGVLEAQITDVVALAGDQDWNTATIYTNAEAQAAREAQA